MTTLLDITLPRTLDAWVDELICRPREASSFEGWLFEGTAARRAAEVRLASAGVSARFYSAYKPLVFHFLEQVDLRGLQRVRVLYPLHAQAPPRRFALEAYPLADMLDGVDFELLPQAAPTDLPHYEVELEWQDGRLRNDTVFAPNHVHPDPTGETLLSPTAWWNGAAFDCDYQQVFRQAVGCVLSHAWPASEPYFERLDLRVELPGVHRAPPHESGWIDSHEALHEDLYFSLLEIFQQLSGRPKGDRRLQPGQIVPDVRRTRHGVVRLRIATVAYPAPVDEPAVPAGTDVLPLVFVDGPLPPSRIAQELSSVGGRHFHANSRQGRPVPGVYRAGSGPAVLISGGQHANETSGVVGALRAGQALAARYDSHFALIPLENPDGYALHRALCRHAPRHMHHAARYTAMGDDLEYREEPPFYEREARNHALAISGALLHINMHGYPAHEWTRPLSGYIPRGFDLWTMPRGFFLIVRHHAGWGERARQLVEQVCLRLAAMPGLMAFNQRQRDTCRIHAGESPFEVIHGTACAISQVDRPGPPLTLITEFPDETIHGPAFVAAHEAQTVAALAAVEVLAGL